ncbi:glycosyltransferase family 4 protein [Enterococcus nangangensis]
MKILIAVNADIGLYKFRKELVEELLKENEVYISLPNGKYVDFFKKIGCKYYQYEFNRRGINPIKEIRHINYYKKLINKIKPDIVFTYTIKPNIYCGMACSSLGVPYIANITGLGTAVESQGIMQKITLRLYKYGLKNAQKVFFQNKENCSFFVSKKIVKGLYDILPGSGVNLKEYKAMPYPDEEPINFMFISRIMKEKGIEQYLEAAKIIRAKYPNTRFHICGFCEQKYEDELKKLSIDGTIVFHGVVEDIVSMHKISSCTIHPTYYPEGLSNVLLESCACGRPIITTNRSGCREVVDNNINGLIVNQKDTQDLVEKIEIFLKMSRDEKIKMGLAGRKKVENEFNRKIIIDKYLAELVEVKNE